MKKLLKFLLYLVGGFAALTGILGIFAKNDYQITRSIEIDAPKFIVMEQVQYFKNHDKWSPWKYLDPAMTTSIEGTDGAQGAVYRWDSKLSDVGKGSQTITAVTPDHIGSDIVLESNFFKSAMPARITVTEQAEKTKVEWLLTFHIPFPWNAAAMFTDIPKKIGADYEQGLVHLQRVCEELANQPFEGYVISFDNTTPQRYYTGERLTIDTSAALTTQARIVPKVLEAFKKNNVSAVDAPTALFWTWGKTTDMAATLVTEKAVTVPNFQCFPIGGGSAISTEYFGPYKGSSAAHKALDAYMAMYKLKFVPPAMERYITDPATEPDTAKWLTKVMYFVEK